MTASEPQHQSFGHYEIERVLGRGAMGTVYLARDQRIGRRVALKTITISPQQFDDPTTAKEFYRRLQREAEVCGSLVHPNIVTLYEAGYQDDRISYLAMEYVEGETLQATMKRARPRPLPLDLSLRIIEEVLRGLSYAHTLNIIHRDIKPGNILIDGEGTAKIADFGIARPQNSSLTGAGALIGTPNYMSPEQVLGQALSPRADVFSVGVMLYEMLTGTKPFNAGDLTGILHNILRLVPPHVSDVNREIPRPAGDLVQRFLSKGAGERPDSAEALAEVEQLRGSSTTRTSPLAPTETTSGRYEVGSGANRRIAMAAAVLALVTAGYGILHAFTASLGAPTALITAEQKKEFRDKRLTISRADAAFDVGRFQESFQLYDAYAQKYPYATAAIEGRERSRQAIADGQKSRRSEPSSAPAKRRRSKKDEDISPSEMLDKIKKIFKH